MIAAPPTPAPPAPSDAARLDDLAEIIRAYNSVTDKLQASHESLKSEVLRLRRELASTNAQLQRSKRLSALGEMAAGIAHEIRNPLAAIALYADMAVQDLADAPPAVISAAENAGKIRDAVRGLNAVVLDVLSFAREVTPRPTTTPATRLLWRAADAHRPAIEAAGVKLVLDIGESDDDDVSVHADADLLHSALLNLIRNAVDAMAEVHDRPRVLTLSARRDRDGADEGGKILSVADTGPGVPPEAVDRLFNPFFTTRHTGTGLGLAIVHRILDAHAAAITVHHAPPPDHGATFRLHLPGPPTPVEVRSSSGQRPAASG